MGKGKLADKRFGMLTVIEDSGQRKGHRILWRCRCDCGGEILATQNQLETGRISDCGCVPKEETPRVKDLVGMRFGKLTVLEAVPFSRSSRGILWRCKCDCGGEIQVLRRQLVSGNVISCGCTSRRYAPRGQAEDLAGRQFGELTVLRRAADDEKGCVCWLCRCSCGRECTVSAQRLKTGHTRSCGCRKYDKTYRKQDLTGQRFGRLTALYPVQGAGKSRKSCWHCRCDCGNETDVYAGNLLTGMTLSCGCWNREQSAQMHDHMHYQDDTCIELLQKAQKDFGKNKAGFRGLFLTKNGRYRVMISFRKVHYTIGYYKTFDEAVRARLDAEESLHAGYIEAFHRYEKKAAEDPAWAEDNPFFYDVTRIDGNFRIHTNEVSP